MRTEEPEKTNRTVRKGAAIFAILIFAVFVTWVIYEGYNTADLINQGCTPKSWNLLGQPTIWNCHRSVNLGFAEADVVTT